MSVLQSEPTGVANSVETTTVQMHEDNPNGREAKLKAWEATPSGNSPEPDRGRIKNPKVLMESGKSTDAVKEGFVKYEDDRAVVLMTSPDGKKLVVSNRKFAAHARTEANTHLVLSLPDANIRAHISETDGLKEEIVKDPDFSNLTITDLKHTSSGFSTPKYHTRETRVYQAALNAEDFSKVENHAGELSESEGQFVIDISSAESLDAFLKDSMEKNIFLDPALVTALYRIRLMRTGKFPDAAQEVKNLQIDKPTDAITQEMSASTNNWFEFAKSGDEEYVVSGNETMAIAFDSDNNVLLMTELSPANEYRPIVMAVSGGWKPAQYSAVDNMVKEMMEELGREAKPEDVEEIGWLAPNPDVLTTQTRVLVMRKVGPTGKKLESADEVTEIFEKPISLDALDEQIHQGGVVMDNRTIAALYMARVHLNI